jgi:hypothetical protein
MKVMKWITIAGLFLISTSSLAAQATDTVTFSVEGLLARAVITQPIENMRVGQTKQFEASASDTDGDPIGAVFSWYTDTKCVDGSWASSQNATCSPAVSIDVTSGLATGLRKTVAGETVYVILTAEQFDDAVVGFYKVGDSPNSISFANFNASVGDQVQSCLYLLRAGAVIATSSGSVGYPCPLGALGPPPDSWTASGRTFRPAVRPYAYLHALAW